jgi:CMP-N-acetylneuraminic acid synthetase
MLTKIIVSTDSKAIAAISHSEGCLVPFMRPGYLANDSAKSIDVACHALLAMEEIDSVVYDAVMLLQPTTPFRSTDDINSSIELLRSDASAESVISVIEVGGNHPARMKYLENGILIDPEFVEEYENQNRQELRPMFIRNGAIYLTKREVLLSKSFKGRKSLAYIMSMERSINIDTLMDFQYAEWLQSKVVY